MKSRKILSLITVLALSTSIFAGCGSTPAADTTTAASTAAASSEAAAVTTPAKTEGGEIYYLNFKPEVVETYKEIAKVYKEETGVTLKVETAASGTYEQKLTSEVAKSEPPVLFQINGPKGYARWKDYCSDLKDTEIYKHLTNKDLAVSVGDAVYGIPYVVEGYGIIYNNAIMNKYFALANKATDVKNMDELNNFAKLKAVVEDMQKNAKALGIKGVFSSTSLKPGEDWRWQSHLANVPLFYEWKDNKTDLTGSATDTIQFQYSDNFKNIFDLYINNSTVAPKILGTKQVTDSMTEFALGQSAMVQNGNWAWGQVSGVKGNTVKAEDIKFMPIYTGMPGEETQGICVGTENFLCINSKVSPEKQKLAADFLYWLYSSAKGKDFVTNKLGFMTSFDTFTDAEKPTDPLAKEVSRWMGKSGSTNVTWNFTLFPNQPFKDAFGQKLLQYCQGTKQWDALKQEVVEKWKVEAAKAVK